MTIKEKQQEIIEEFAFLDDWEQKYEYIIDLGKELKGLPKTERPMTISSKAVRVRFGLMLNLKMESFF